MTEYRRAWLPGAAWFFTVNLAERRGNRHWVSSPVIARSVPPEQSIPGNKRVGPRQPLAVASRPPRDACSAPKTVQCDGGDRGHVPRPREPLGRSAKTRARPPPRRVIECPARTAFILDFTTGSCSPPPTTAAYRGVSPRADSSGGPARIRSPPGTFGTCPNRGRRRNVLPTIPLPRRADWRRIGPLPARARLSARRELGAAPAGERGTGRRSRKHRRTRPATV